METPTELRKIIKEMPEWMEKEKVLLRLAADSWDNHLCWAYGNKPYNHFDQELFDEIVEIIKCRILEKNLNNKEKNNAN